MLGDSTEKTITVDSEEISLKLTEATSRERRVDYTVVDYTYRYVNVSWTFECYIKDIQRTILCTDNYSNFIHLYIIDAFMCTNICIFHTDISPLSFSIGDYVGL